MRVGGSFYLPFSGHGNIAFRTSVSCGQSSEHRFYPRAAARRGFHSFGSRTGCDEVAPIRAHPREIRKNDSRAFAMGRSPRGSGKRVELRTWVFFLAGPIHSPNAAERQSRAGRGRRKGARERTFSAFPITHSKEARDADD